MGDFIFLIHFLNYTKLCLFPAGLSIRRKPFIEFESDNLIVSWKETLLNAVNNLLEDLCVEICERMQITCSSVKAIEKNKYEED